MRNAAMYAAGLAMGGANTVRHRIQGYVTPRPFDPADIRRTIDHAVGVVDRLERHGRISWSGKRVLECGPGSDMATGAVMLARGGAGYHAVDLFDNRDQASPALYDELGRMLGVPVDPGELGFTQATFPQLPELEGEFDLIVSNATLEHVDDVPGLFRSFARVAAPDSRMVHHIDGQTHMRWIKEIDPLNILRYSDGLYDRVLSFPGAPNRLRAESYEQAAAGAGWEVVEVVPDVVADPGYLSRTRVAPRFRRGRSLD